MGKDGRIKEAWQNLVKRFQKDRRTPPTPKSGPWNRRYWEPNQPPPSRSTVFGPDYN